ncbi:juvenile hormone esterase precursor [Danaus plexippus plexippus]|uniref:Carboxylic ester hydrolase n=1 Tax=Danaus plexippus plexippus TaxID=278856 RepID=A0A212EHB6_DANPL|nr:juvenile hormone esterase precursor [Danaus plexippus plexippus]
MRRPATETSLELPPFEMSSLVLSALVLSSLVLPSLVLPAQAVPLSDSDGCAVRAQLPGGWLCGLRNGTSHASFLGVPYAKQPLGQLRFKELQPLEPWEGFYDATSEGPICPQHDILYGALNPGQMDEACMYANIHVPLHALPGYQPAKTETDGLPILVMIHGGGFAFGSGGLGLHGPDYLMPIDVIVITFNYRLNVLGFLSLNTSYVPGNNGLRDIVTLLRWVQDNAYAFGGDPGNVTIVGQSAGATSAHLLTLSTASRGLFNRAIIMSGTAISSFYTPSPMYAQLVANMFLTSVGINSTDPEEVHQRLVDLPIERIMEANKQLQNHFGLTVFTPVVESSFPGVTAVVDRDPELLMSQGCGAHIPLIIGFTNSECEVFRRSFQNINILERIKDNPLLSVPIKLLYGLPPQNVSAALKKIQEQYFIGEPTIDEYVKYASDAYYKQPAIKVAMMRRMLRGAPAYLYEFSYHPDFSVIGQITGLNYKGAEHIEDLSFLFRAKAFEGSKGFSPLSLSDQSMVHRMTTIVKNFMEDRDPWPPVSDGTELEYQVIDRPEVYQFSGLSKQLKEMADFFDSL